MTRFLTLLFILLSFLITSASSFAFSTADRALLDKIEDYLNSFKSFKSEFYQVTSQGKESRGILHAKRPGLMRVEYEKEPILLLANRKWLIHYDKQLEQPSHFALEDSPLAILLKETITFKDPGLSIEEIKKQQNVISVRLRQKKNKDAGSLTLIFTDAPLELKKWILKDAQQNETEVTLTSLEKNLPLKDSLFQFQDPTFGKKRER